MITTRVTQVFNHTSALQTAKVVCFGEIHTERHQQSFQILLRTLLTACRVCKIYFAHAVKPPQIKRRVQQSCTAYELRHNAFDHLLDVFVDRVLYPDHRIHSHYHVANTVTTISTAPAGNNQIRPKEAKTAEHRRAAIRSSGNRDGGSQGIRISLVGKLPRPFGSCNDQF
jgi:hypothetical protein